jgi:hypothetical protein
MTTQHKATSTATPTPEPREHLLQLTRGYRVTQVLYAAASLRIAEALRSGPCGARDLAAAVGAHEPSLVRLLSTLISLGLLETGSDGRYDLTDTGRLLDGQHPGSVRAGILYEGRSHPISLDSAFPNGGMAMNHGGWDGEEADESQAWGGRVLGTEWAGGVAGAMERPAEDGTGPAPAPG